MQGYPPRAFEEGDTDSNYPSPGKEEKKTERRGVINRVNRMFSLMIARTS
jgi:hypothetical protein